jgi:very-short-patch-repair endonuclease
VRGQPYDRRCTFSIEATKHPLRNARTLGRARALRRTMTDAERILWSRLRNRRFAHYKFRRQVPLGPFIADFVCFDRRLIVELDGGQHAQQKEYDADRTNWLAENGFRVVRFWNHELTLDREAVEELIWSRLQGG